LTPTPPGSIGSGWPHATIPLRRLAGGRLEWEGRLPAEAPLWSGTGVRLEEEPTFRLEVELSADGGVHAAGTLEARYRLRCRRCLGEMTHRVRLPVDVWYEPAVDEDSGDEAVYSMPPGATEIDIAPAMRDELILALPEYPVCRSDCAGLCTGCGADLNVERCSCGPKEIDPRWQALRALGDTQETERK
jgi:uncharacterized protein